MPSSAAARAASIAACGKRALAIDVLGFRGGRGCDGRGALEERTSIDKQLFAGSDPRRTAEPGFLHVHGRYNLQGLSVRNLSASIARFSPIAQRHPDRASRLWI
jgi:hypothetical protein